MFYLDFWKGCDMRTPLANAKLSVPSTGGFVFEFDARVAVCLTSTPGARDAGPHQTGTVRTESLGFGPDYLNTDPDDTPES